MTRPALIAGFVAAISSALLAAPQQAVVRGGVDEVRVDVHVTDNRGRPVTDLQAEDLEVTDDGQPQQILTFTAVKASTSGSGVASAGPAAPASISTAPTTVAPAADPRTVVIVLDDLHVDASNSARVTRAVKSFLGTVVARADQVAVVFTSGANGGGQNATTDRQRVLTVVDAFRGQKLRSPSIERQQDPKIRVTGRPIEHPDPVEPERENRARIVTDALTRIGDALGRLRDQRSLVLLVSEGPEYEEVQRRRSGTSDQWSMNDGIERAVQSLNRAGAVVYAIDPRGVSTGNPAQIESSSPIAGAGASSIQGENVRAFGVLQAVAVNTGGMALLWRPDMQDSFRRITDADGSYYIVGYALPMTNRGAYHRIGVRAKRRGVDVRARSGYFLSQP